MGEHFEAIVVGAGPAGNAAALTLARAGVDVLQLERAEYPGARNATGALLYAPALQELIPDFHDKAPLERRIVEQRTWTLDAHSHVGSHWRQQATAATVPDRYTILRGPFDAWLSSAVKASGVRVAFATTVTDLIREDDGRVIGVRTNGDGEYYADVVVLGEGVEALVARRSGLREELEPADVALTVKELRRLPADVLERRFGVEPGEGVIVEAAGTFAPGFSGTGFIYTNSESISVGVGCLVGEIVDSDVTPSELLDRFKRHPSIRALLADTEVVQFTAQLFPEGGYRVRPRLFGDGWVTCGDATQLNVALYREGATIALGSGRLAGETIVELRRHGRPMTARHLSLYRDKLERSPMLREIRRHAAGEGVAPEERPYVAVDPRRLPEAASALQRSTVPGERRAQTTLLRGLLRSRRSSHVLRDAV